MIRICKDGKRKFISLGISVHPQHWDFTKKQPKRNCPNREYIEKLIAEKSREYAETIIEMKADGRDFTATTLQERMHGKKSKPTVENLFAEQIGRLRSTGRLGYAMNLQDTCNSLRKYLGHLDIYFSSIDADCLYGYESWQRKQGIGVNTIGRRMRILQMMYNTAVKKQCAKAADSPFLKYKASRLHEETAKRSLRKEDILRIIGYETDNRPRRFALDLFIFSYCMGGINFIDMAYLTERNIRDGHLAYERHKTHKKICLPLQEQAVEILSRYRRPESPYLFPILNSTYKTEQQQRNRIRKMLESVNKRLRAIGKELELPIKLTTYVARHSFATILKHSGVNIGLISEALGHSNPTITQVYLARFEDSQVADAMKHLL